jgi:hypothetical protein
MNDDVNMHEDDMRDDEMRDRNQTTTRARTEKGEITNEDTEMTEEEHSRTRTGAGE